MPAGFAIFSSSSSVRLHRSPMQEDLRCINCNTVLYLYIIIILSQLELKAREWEGETCFQITETWFWQFFLDRLRSCSRSHWMLIAANFATVRVSLRVPHPCVFVASANIYKCFQGDVLGCFLINAVVGFWNILIYDFFLCSSRSHSERRWKFLSVKIGFNNEVLGADLAAYELWAL